MLLKSAHILMILSLVWPVSLFAEAVSVVDEIRSACPNAASALMSKSEDGDISLYSYQIDQLNNNYRSILSKYKKKPSDDIEILKIVAWASDLSSKSKIAISVFSKLEKIERYKVWATFHLMKYKGKKPLVKFCRNSLEDIYLLIDCYKVTNDKNVLIRAEKLAHRTSDPYKNWYQSKIFQIHGDIDKAINVLESVSEKSASHQTAIKELIYLYSKSKDYKKGNRLLKKLFSSYDKNPYHNLLAFDFYKAFSFSYLANLHLRKAKECLSENSLEMSSRIGYVSESMGLRINKKYSVKSKISSNVSNFRVFEVIQNRSQDLGLNLYNFRNESALVEVDYTISKNRRVGATLGLNQKTGTVEETDYSIALMHERKKKSTSGVITRFDEIKFMPVFNKKDEGFNRNSFEYKTSYNFLSDKSSSSYLVEGKYGLDRNFNTNKVATYVELNMFTDYIRVGSLRMPVGFRLKKSFDDVSPTNITSYGSFQKYLIRRLLLGVYAEYFYVPSTKSDGLMTEFKTQVDLPFNLGVFARYSVEMGLSFEEYEQTRITFGAHKNFILGSTMYRAQVSHQKLSHKSLVNYDDSFFNLSVGVGF